MYAVEKITAGKSIFYLAAISSPRSAPGRKGRVGEMTWTLKPKNDNGVSQPVIQRSLRRWISGLRRPAFGIPYATGQSRDLASPLSRYLGLPTLPGALSLEARFKTTNLDFPHREKLSVIR